MLQRYDYEPARSYGSKDFGIFDRQAGMVTRVYNGEVPKYVAICTDIDQAQRIVDLLNADEKAKK